MKRASTVVPQSPLEKYRSEISRCVKCGACSAVCPTYLHERAEAFSARGRMALIEAVLDKRLGVSRRYIDRLATCTSCLACEASCASNVPVTEIVQAAKEQAVEEAGVGTVGVAVSFLLKHPAVFRAVARLAPIALHYTGGSIKGRGISSEFGAQSAKFALRSRWHSQTLGAGKVQRSGKTGHKREGKKGTVLFFPGCAVRYFQPDIGIAVSRVLNTIGYDVVVPEGLQCCGRPLLSLGDRAGAAALAESNTRLFAGLEADAIVTACASCGLTFKREYPKLLRPGAKRPAIIDIHEFLADHLGGARLAPVKKEITVHDPCHLGRGQGLSKTVRELLCRIPGITVREMRDPDRCCGFGGVMRVTHRGLSDGVAEKKVNNIIATNASVVATGCPGCRMQITDALCRAGSGVKVLHPVQVLEIALRDAGRGTSKK